MAEIFKYDLLIFLTNDIERAMNLPINKVKEYWLLND